ncbi:MAG: helix-turn-helix transcriptional regulator [Candidatus Hodarchaeota archaeon]
MVHSIKYSTERILSLGFLTFAFLLLVNATAFAEDEMVVESTKLIVYRDGTVHLRHIIRINETDPAITLPLFSSSIDNVIIVDENKSVLYYSKDGSNLTIFTLGTKTVYLEYDTSSLTNKEAEVWTLVIDNPYNSTIYLPEESTIIYFSESPNAIEMEDNKMVLFLLPGHWEISYILPLATSDEPTENGEYSSTIPVEYLIVIIIALVLFLLLAFILVRKRGPNVEKIFKAHPQLRQEEKDVVLFLAENKGKAFEAEIRKRFPDLPRTSLWRLVRRLEKLEIVKIKKIGLGNRVELTK